MARSGGASKSRGTALPRLTGLPARLESAKRKRALGSQARTGRYARGLALGAVAAFTRTFWLPLLGILLLPPALFVPLAVFFVPGPFKFVIIGAASSCGVWLAVITLVLLSGVGPGLASVVAEQWTADDLRRFSRNRLVNGLKLMDKSDIDHVTVSTQGLLVVETKWGADEWVLDGGSFQAARARDAVAQVSRGAKWLYGSLGKARSGLPDRAVWVRPVVVLQSPIGHGPTSSVVEQAYEDWRVTVVHAPYLRDWLSSLPSDVLSAAEVNRLWDAIDRRVRDYESGPGRAVRPTVGRLVNEWLVKPGAGMALAILAVRGVTAEHEVALLAILWLAAAAVTVPGLRVKKTRNIALGWGTVWAFFTVVACILLTVGWRL